MPSKACMQIICIMENYMHNGKLLCQWVKSQMQIDITIIIVVVVIVVVVVIITIIIIY